jgi:thiamine pyrophosphokinase
MYKEMITLIFASGVLNQSTYLDALIKKADLLIAADGGANHCARFGITPDILLGDLDSIDPAVLADYQKKGITIHRHPRRKDATDLELALDLAMRESTGTVWLIGALGGRWDMSLANIMLAAGNSYLGLEIFLLGQDCFMQILHPGKKYTLSVIPGQKVSFLPLKNDALGVTLTGVEYPLTDHTISFGSTLGISNIIKKHQATVQHTEGVLLCILFYE